MEQPPKPLYFLSYARQDGTIAQEFYLAYAADPRFDLWFDQASIAPGRDWNLAIREGLDRCRGVILLGSQFSMASPYVKDEWLYALQALHKPIYLWRIDNGAIDPLLASVPVHDLREDPLSETRWQQGISAILAEQLPSTTWDAATVLPPYVNHFLRRYLAYRWAWHGFGVFLLISALILHGPPDAYGVFSRNPQFVPIVAGIGLGVTAFSWWFGTRRIVAQIKRRSYFWNDVPLTMLIIDVGAFLAAILAALIGLPPILLVLATLTMAGLVLLVPYSWFDPNWVRRFLFGNFQFPYRNRQWLEREISLNIGSIFGYWLIFLRGKQVVNTTRLLGWLPAFSSQSAHRQNPIRRAAASDQLATVLVAASSTALTVATRPSTYSEPQVAPTPLIPPEPAMFTIICDPADVYLVDFVCTQLAPIARFTPQLIQDWATSTEADSVPTRLVCVLSRRSGATIRTILPSLEQRSNQQVVLLIAERHRDTEPIIRALNRYQQIELQNWDLTGLVEDLSHLRGDLQPSFSGRVDRRARKKNNRASIFWLCAFAIPLIACLLHILAAFASSGRVRLSSHLSNALTVLQFTAICYSLALIAITVGCQRRRLSWEMTAYAQGIFLVVNLIHFVMLISNPLLRQAILDSAPTQSNAITSLQLLLLLPLLVLGGGAFIWNGLNAHYKRLSIFSRKISARNQPFDAYLFLTLKQPLMWWILGAVASGGVVVLALLVNLLTARY